MEDQARKTLKTPGLHKKYNARVQARKTDTSLKENMIIWHHIYGTRNNYNMNKPASKCLRNSHKIKTVREMKDYVKKHRQGAIGKCKKHNCLKMAEKLLETLGDKWNPVKCTPYKDNLDHTPKRKEANERIGNGPTLYNPDVTEKDDPEKEIRIFLRKPKKGEENLK